MQGHHRRTWVVAALIAALALTLFAVPYLLGSEIIETTFGTLYANARGNTGEWISVKLDLGGALRTGHSWTVNGSGSYLYLVLKCSIHVEFTNVENVVLEYVKIKAVDYVDGSYYVYVLTNNKAITSSPYDNTFSTGQIAIETHLSDHVQADQYDTDKYLVRYFVTVKVQGTGTISGETLTAEIPWKWFVSYRYSCAPSDGGHSPYPGEGDGGGGTISWVLIPAASMIGLAALTFLAFWWARRELRRGARA